MRVLVVSDHDFASRERAMLARLEVGLVDEGVRIIHAIPERSAGDIKESVHSPLVTFRDTGTSLSRGWRARQLLGRLEELVRAEGTPIDLVHAFGLGSWDVACRVAEELDAAVVLEIWRAELAVELGGLRAPGDVTLAALVPDPAIEAHAREIGVGVPIRVVRWGVHAASAPVGRGDTPPRVASMLLLASGRDPLAIEDGLRGIAGARAALGEFLVFAATEAIEAARLWSRIGALGLADRVTLVPHLEDRRELALRAQALLLPEALGEHRSLVLDAMGHGLTVVAAADPFCAEVLDPRVARLVEPRERSARVAAWTEALSWLGRSPAEAAAMGRSAWEHVRAKRRASTHVAELLSAYQWALGREVIAFPSGSR